MISRARKFPLRTEFLSFRAKSEKISSQYFTVYYLASESHSGIVKPEFSIPECKSRLAVVVPKKVNKLATVRNWLKRLVYDHLWPLIREKNLDVIIVFKPLSLIKSAQTKDLLISQLNDIKILH